jgi:hypothetical protein
MKSHKKQKKSNLTRIAAADKIGQPIGNSRA